MAMTRETVLFRDSEIPKVAEAVIEVRTGRKWKVSHEFSTAGLRCKIESASSNRDSGQIRSRLLSQFSTDIKKEILKTLFSI